MKGEILNYFFVKLNLECKKTMEEWAVNLIVGLASALLGFISGFFTKTFQVKIKQKAKGNNIKQNIGNINDEK